MRSACYLCRSEMRCLEGNDSIWLVTATHQGTPLPSFLQRGKCMCIIALLQGCRKEFLSLPFSKVTHLPSWSQE